MKTEYKFKIPKEKMTQFLLKFRHKISSISPLSLEIFSASIWVKYSGKINKEEMEYVKGIALPYFSPTPLSKKNTKIVINETTRTEI